MQLKEQKQKVINNLVYITQDVDQVREKLWLREAATSHVKRLLVLQGEKLDPLYVKGVVYRWFEEGIGEEGV